LNGGEGRVRPQGKTWRRTFGGDQKIPPGIGKRKEATSKGGEWEGGLRSTKRGGGEGRKMTKIKGEIKWGKEGLQENDPQSNPGSIKKGLLRGKKKKITNCVLNIETKG